MNKVTIRFQVFFEEPFWIGIGERMVDGKIAVCKITFGQEPKDYEIEQYILTNWYHLKFSEAMDAVINQTGRMNPKRQQRNIKKQMSDMGIGTKSQQALKLQHEKAKEVRRKKSRVQKEAECERKFTLKQQKRKEKHKGR